MPFAEGSPHRLHTRPITETEDVPRQQGGLDDESCHRRPTGACDRDRSGTGADNRRRPAPDAAVEAKFKAADKNSNGTLEGAEVDAFKANLTKIDTNKDGKVTRDEFAAATKAGTIK